MHALNIFSNSLLVYGNIPNFQVSDQCLFDLLDCFGDDLAAIFIMLVL